jgi:hypothetical protein
MILFPHIYVSCIFNSDALYNMIFIKKRKAKHIFGTGRVTGKNFLAFFTNKSYLLNIPQT